MPIPLRIRMLKLHEVAFIVTKRCDSMGARMHFIIKRLSVSLVYVPFISTTILSFVLSSYHSRVLSSEALFHHAAVCWDSGFMLCTKAHHKYSFNSLELWPLLEHKLLEGSFLHSPTGFFFSHCDKTFSIEIPAFESLFLIRKPIL